MELDKRELPILDYFDQEYGNTIDVYYLPGSYSNYHIWNIIKDVKIGSLHIKNNGVYDVSYEDSNSTDFIKRMFGVVDTNIQNSFIKWLLIKSKCSTIKEFKTKIDNESINHPI
jgi:hypothetical protein